MWQPELWMPVSRSGMPRPQPGWPAWEGRENMKTVVTECEPEHMVGTATPAPVPATTAAAGRPPAARRALPHQPAQPGGSPPTRGPARRAPRRAEMTMPSRFPGDGLSDHVLLGSFATGDANTGAAFVRR